jgi:hypothetical protein
MVAQLFTRLGMKSASAECSPSSKAAVPPAAPRIADPGPNNDTGDVVWEPNEHAFSVSKPRGWKISGGIFNIQPGQTNGPGNTLLPKCDFTVRKDDPGTVMARWVASWNFADLTCGSPAGAFFQPGTWYQGMPVRFIVSARQFLLELLSAERPQAGNFRLIAENQMPEITTAFEKQAEPVNVFLRQQGLNPITFETSSIVVRYTEGGRDFVENLATTIADSRQSAFMWTNDNTVMFRSPLSEFDKWMPVLVNIQSSRKVDQQWAARAARAGGERARIAMAAQSYVNGVMRDITEKRRQYFESIRAQYDAQWACE